MPETVRLRRWPPTSGQDLKRSEALRLLRGGPTLLVQCEEVQYGARRRSNSSYRLLNQWAVWSYRIGAQRRRRFFDSAREALDFAIGAVIREAADNRKMERNHA